MFPRLFLPGVLLLLTACTRTGHLETENLQFQTLITPDNIKRFQVSVSPKPIDPLRAINRDSSRDGEDNRSLSQERGTDSYLRSELNAALKQNGYCRSGYLLLGRFAGQSQYRLRGECKDVATEQDRSKFPNTIERW